MGPLLENWLLPPLAAGLSSHLTSWLWSRFSKAGGPHGSEANLLTALCVIMGAVSAQYRAGVLDRNLENNIIVMFCAGAATTFSWLLLRRYLPPGKHR